jgi:hypothetical protein
VTDLRAIRAARGLALLIRPAAASRQIPKAKPDSDGAVARQLELSTAGAETGGVKLHLPSTAGWGVNGPRRVSQSGETLLRRVKLAFKPAGDLAGLERVKPLAL